MRWLYVYIVLFIFSGNVLSQDLTINWQDHLPYKNVLGVEVATNQVYAFTRYSVFTVDKNTDEVTRISKIEGLTETLISTIKWSEEKQALVIGYIDGNIDIYRNGNVINVAGIKESGITGDRQINNIDFYNQKAYLSCGFGIAVLDLDKDEISESGYLGAGSNQIPVHDITVNSNELIAVTDNGVYHAPLNGNLADYNIWQADSFFAGVNCNLVENYQGMLWVNVSSPAYNSDSAFRKNGAWQKIVQSTSRNSWSMNATPDGVVMTHNNSFQLLDKYGNLEKDFFGLDPNEVEMDGNGNFWLASSFAGLVKIDSNMNITNYLSPSGPATKNAVDMDFGSAGVYVVPGGKNSSWNNLWNIDGVFHYDEKSWNTINGSRFSQMDTCHDLVCVKIDPSDGNSVFAGSWGRGLLEFYGDSLITIHGPGNSSLESRPEIYWIGIGGVDFDNQHNMWVTTSYTVNQLNVRTSAGTWKSFTLGENVKQTASVGKLAVDHNGYKWILLSKIGEVAVYDDNNTVLNEQDDQVIILDQSVGSGHLSGTYISALHVDKEGVVWIGSNDGISFCDDSKALVQGSQPDMKLALDEDGAQMLKYRSVNVIKTDAQNRKWIGTESDGLYWLSDDCSKILAHFTEDNSPLFSSSILSLTVNDEGDQVFVGTSRGIISLQIIPPPEPAEIDQVLVYPNPSSGQEIMISGIGYGNTIQLMDFRGRIIDEATINYVAQAYNLRTIMNANIAPGSYLIKCKSASGKTSGTAKILIAR